MHPWPASKELEISSTFFGGGLGPLVVLLLAGFGEEDDSSYANTLKALGALVTSPLGESAGGTCMIVTLLGATLLASCTVSFPAPPTMGQHCPGSVPLLSATPALTPKGG